MPIDTPEDLQAHIELAIQVELATIPQYLYAMYSIEDQTSESALLIRSIVAEEMLHTALAANLLLAVGGRPQFDSSSIMPTYPGFLPHHQPPLRLNLVACSLRLIREVFMRIEQPEVHGAPPEPDAFETLGQFYHALEEAIVKLSKQHDLFAKPQADHQLSDPGFYSPVAYDEADSGGLTLIDGVGSALAAIEVIVHQGEGLSTDRWADPSHKELTHYHKLLQISEGVSPLGRVRPLAPNPTTATYPDGLQPVSDLFNACYRYLFLILAELFGPLQDKSAAVGRIYDIMMRGLSGLARFLVQQPVEDGHFAGPTFEIFEFNSPTPEAELAELTARVVRLHPELGGVGETITELSAAPDRRK
jgi:rubrerythrin